MRLRAITNKNPVVLVDTPGMALDLAMQGNHILFGQEDGSLRYASQQLCDMAFITEGMPVKSVYFLFGRNSTLVHRFDHAIGMQRGFIRRTHSKARSDLRSAYLLTFSTSPAA